MEILKFNISNLLNKPKKTTVPHLPLPRTNNSTNSIRVDHNKYVLCWLCKCSEFVKTFGLDLGKARRAFSVEKCFFSDCRR